MYADNENQVRDWLTRAAVGSGLGQTLASKIAGEAIRSKAVYDQQDLDLMRPNDLKLGPAGWIGMADDKGVVVAPTWLDVVSVISASISLVAAAHAPSAVEKVAGIITSLTMMASIPRRISEQEAALLCELDYHGRNCRIPAVVVVDGANIRLAGRPQILHPIKQLITDLQKKGARLEHFGVGITAEIEFKDFVRRIK